VDFLRRNASVHVFYRLFIYVLPLEIQLSRVLLGTPLTGLTRHIFVSVQSQDLDIQRRGLFVSSEFS